MPGTELFINCQCCLYQYFSIVCDLLQITIGLCFSLGCIHANNLMYQEYNYRATLDL